MNFEMIIYNKLGLALANIRPYVESFSFSETINQAESLTITLNVEKVVENLLKPTNSTFKDFFNGGTTELVLIANNQPRFRVLLNSVSFETDENTTTAALDFSGLLNFYSHQYIDIAYNGVAQGDILWGVIEQCNQKPNADLGIRKGPNVSQFIRDRNETRKQVKDFIQRMSKVQGGCDFEFTWNKLFNTYDAIGVYKPEILLQYPGNISSFDIPVESDTIANYIYGLGSGNGEDVKQVVVQDEISQLGKYRREKIITYNSVTSDETLLQNTSGVLDLIKDEIELPRVTLRPNSVDFNNLRIGDTVELDLSSKPIFDHISGPYRVQKINSSVDTNNALTLTITFDDYNIDDILDAQEEINE